MRSVQSSLLTLLATAVCALPCQAQSSEKATVAELGKPAPNFEATGLDGKKFQLSDKIGKKNIVLMFSRAYW